MRLGDFDPVSLSLCSTSTEGDLENIKEKGYKQCTLIKSCYIESPRN